MPIVPAKIIVGGDAPMVVHVPHASTLIPPAIREQILLDDAELAREIVRLTDWHVDDLFDWTLELGATLFVNQLSRLVFDPERFADDEQEPMAKVGQGVVYTHSTQGELLAEITPEERAKRIRDLYEPYHEALSAVVSDALERFGTCLILDCHSFATVPLPSELDQAPDRPDVCIGTDGFHTPAELVEALGRGFTERRVPSRARRSVRRDAGAAGGVPPRPTREVGDDRDTAWALL